jgi:hypothetical protein
MNALEIRICKPCPLMLQTAEFDNFIWIGSQGSSVRLIPTARIGCVYLVAIFSTILLLEVTSQCRRVSPFIRSDWNNLQLLVHLFWCSHTDSPVYRLFFKTFWMRFVSFERVTRDRKLVSSLGRVKAKQIYQVMHCDILLVQLTTLYVLYALYKLRIKNKGL